MWQKLCEVWTRTKICSPNISYIVAIYALFERLWEKKCFYLGQKVPITWYKFAITRKNDAFLAKIGNTIQTKICMAIFALAERLPTSATLHIAKVISLKETRFQPKNFVSRTTAAHCTEILQLLIVPNRESH